MKNRGVLLIGLLVLCLFLMRAGLACANYEYIDISNPFLRKIPVALPVFESLSDGSNTIAIASEGAAILSGALAFTGYFKILDRGAFLTEPGKSGITAAQIKFRDWTSIGAELLITGGIAFNGQSLELEMRLFDTFKGQLLVGKRYKGWREDLRRMIHRFCDEVIYRLTGSHGVFNSKMAFVSTGTGNKEIFICDFDGSNVRQLTHSKSIALSPAWSSDGKWIAYTAYAKGKPDLYIRNLRREQTVVVARKGLNITPAWVPGKFELAATLSFSGDPEIYLLTGKGKITKRLTENWGIDVSPVWSPDGKKLAFVSNRSGTPQIYVKNIRSGSVQRLTFEGKYNTTPSWSPKGDRIAYSASTDGQFNIFVVDADGRNSVQLTQDTGDNESPSWSPDGSLIVFSSTREGRSRLYVMTALGTEQRRLLLLPGEQMNPKWSPWLLNR